MAMKNKSLILIALFIFVCCATCTRTKYAVKKSTDINGYEYEYVTNDPMAIRQYTECADPARISSNVAKIVPAACHGRVYHLYVALGAAMWGECDLEQDTVTVHDEARPGNENLVNVAVVQTIMNGGSVYALPPDKNPEGAAVAALFRY